MWNDQPALWPLLMGLLNMAVAGLAGYILSAAESPKGLLAAFCNGREYNHSVRVSFPD